ncbi:hypothetical protein NPIL_85131 [Nephila pilipes]|uniref:Uncharacterized protein n=1 Tax=Nephila pilipes TaxID=299642 RepID=A0A8X6N465_NEPPI|nr:hypothetical protein NPIL_85131 [Nephila pilipes]
MCIPLGISPPQFNYNETFDEFTIGISASLRKVIYPVADVKEDRGKKTELMLSSFGEVVTSWSAIVPISWDMMVFGALYE